MVKKCPPQYSVQLFFVFWDKPQIHNLPKPEQSTGSLQQGGLYVCTGGLGIQKFGKISTDL